MPTAQSLAQDAQHAAIAWCGLCGGWKFDAEIAYEYWRPEPFEYDPDLSQFPPLGMLCLHHEALPATPRQS